MATASFEQFKPRTAIFPWSKRTPQYVVLKDVALYADNKYRIKTLGTNDTVPRIEITD
jgi:hypothetical protein